ncbi:acyl-[acyl-carrier-protein] thioesterase [Atopobium sp. oral taxon 416]|uniref:acyl-[acyl-carrier-protein] thioesterase n=1 Tax=Atopobium sp. oral taxon 416 TaxID=712157 RepID=UPI001BAAD833|nr:acyl-ACP thioesterase domain-containing protein [Atopobium sp. oral taxon 416]QUC04811.1 acyl-[acyl-carrier-protein] thioesterase [Atopobium sp. oral taxon 416]
MYSFTSRIRYSEIDKDAHLSLLGCMNYLQDCGTFQAEHLGIGLDHMHKFHYGWIVGTWHIEIDQTPLFGEPITISTWAYEVKGFSGKRNFTIKDKDGHAFLKADSLWFPFDLKAQKVIHVPKSDLAYLDPETPRLDLPPLPRTIKPKGIPTQGRPIVVSEALLDTNDHMNNAYYISLAQAALPNRLPHVIEVQYRRAATLDDTMVPDIYNTPQGGHIVDLRDPYGTTYAVIHFEREEAL